MNITTWMKIFMPTSMSRLVSVLLNPSTSAPPPSWVPDDSSASLFDTSPVTFFSMLFPISLPRFDAAKYEQTKAGIEINTSSEANWRKIFPFDIPIESNTAISFFLAFIHRNRRSETTSPANIKAPANSLLASPYTPEIDF